jgi:hypothetical protein
MQHGCQITSGGDALAVTNALRGPQLRFSSLPSKRLDFCKINYTLTKILCTAVPHNAGCEKLTMIFFHESSQKNCGEKANRILF